MSMKSQVEFWKSELFEETTEVDQTKKRTLDHIKNTSDSERNDKTIYNIG